MTKFQVTVAVFGPDNADFSEKVESVVARWEQQAKWAPGPARVELFRYRDLVIRVAIGAAIVDLPAEDRLAVMSGVRLIRPAPFYDYGGKAPESADGFSAIVVNRMDPADADGVAELFGGLDATDFPTTMGTRSRRLYSVKPNIYLHVQEFAGTGQADGLAVIDEAWRDADPRFVRIVADLTPLVRAYDEACTTHDDHLAQRFYVRTSS